MEIPLGMEGQLIVSTLFTILSYSSYPTILNLISDFFFFPPANGTLLA